VKKTDSPILAYWLLPAEPFAAYLTILIRTLAERFDAAIFAPHVTLYAGPEIVGDSPERILRETTRKHSRIVLRKAGIRHSDQFTKTVYIEFEETDNITKLSEQLRQSHSHSSGYEFRPHLSLIYASLKVVQREEIVASCVLPFSEIAFDHVTAIMAPGKPELRADVEAWQSACGVHPLGGSKARRRLSTKRN
jgi:2'-5' RNA ligase